MTTQPMAALLTALRVAVYAGFVLWAGPLTFWTLVWPTGHRHRRLLRLLRRRRRSAHLHLDRRAGDPADRRRPAA